MSNAAGKQSKSKTLKAILSLKTRKKGIGRLGRQLNRLMGSIKSVGLIESTEIAGTQGNFLIVDGASWDKTRQEMGLNAPPSFILWEENAFFRFLETYISELDRKSHTSLTRKKSEKKTTNTRKRA